MQVLDLASGTGDLALLEIDALLPLGQVVGCDLSGQMLRWAQKKFEKLPAAGWHLKLVNGKAEGLPFADNTFDAATIGFALRNVSDLDKTFSELHRVLKPGGRIGLLEFGRPRNPFMRLGHWFWLSIGVPLLGIATTWTVWPFLYLRRSILRFMAPEEVVERLKRAGFKTAAAQSLDGNIVVLYTGVK
jgi:demethylmenaquinone methyltransferase/2-methoxy-6-polyprenyl-1,4-benzoquinol methylase